MPVLGTILLLAGAFLAVYPFVNPENRRLKNWNLEEMLEELIGWILMVFTTIFQLWAMSP